MSLTDEKITILESKLRELGEMALRMRENKPDIHLKGNDTFVTEVDLAIDKALTVFLPSVKNVPVFSEEHINDEKSSSCWIIDPIDGTSAFISGLPTWSIAVALMENNQIVFGMLYFPAFQRLIHSDMDDSVFKQIQWPSEVTKESFATLPSRFHLYYDITFPGKIRSLGSATSQILMAATGQSLFTFLGRIFLWDFATAIPLLKRANLELFYLDGEDFDSENIKVERDALERPLIAAPKGHRNDVIAYIKKKK